MENRQLERRLIEGRLLLLTIKQALIIAVVFGIVAAAVVWWLERFEINKFHGEVQDYLRNQGAFHQWLQERGQNGEG